MYIGQDLIEVRFYPNDHESVTIQAHNGGYNILWTDLLTGRSREALGVYTMYEHTTKENYEKAYEKVREMYPNIMDFHFKD